jgi:hypothetical protein
MPEDDTSKKEVLKTLVEILLKDEELKKSLGRYTAITVLTSVSVTIVEMTYGLPIITVASAPFVGPIVAFLIASVLTFIRSGKPKTLFYACPNFSCSRQERYFAIRWSSLPLYRKQKGCPDCGARLIKRCQRGKHYIVSPAPENPDQQPKLDSCCPFCDPEIPRDERVYIPRTTSQLPLTEIPRGTINESEIHVEPIHIPTKPE